MVFAEPSRCRASSTPSLSPLRVMMSRSRCPRTTLATSSTRTRPAGVSRTIVRRSWSRSSNSCRVRTRYSAPQSCTVPPGWFTFSASSAAARSAIERPRAARRSRSTSTWISGSRPPRTLAAATPRRDSKRGLIQRSDSWRRSSRGRSLVRDRRTIGSREGSKRSTRGTSVPSGSCTSPSFSRTSREAKSISSPHSNSSTTSEIPAREVLRRSRTPGITPTASSTGLVTNCSTESGAASG